jgi:hypothetical protein
MEFIFFVVANVIVCIGFIIQGEIELVMPFALQGGTCLVH